MFLGLWGDDEKYRQTYWTKFPGLYYAGDYALVDEEGYLWLLGRADDALVAGHTGLARWSWRVHLSHTRPLQKPRDGQDLTPQKGSL